MDGGKGKDIAVCRARHGFAADNTACHIRLDRNDVRIRLRSTESARHMSHIAGIDIDDIARGTTGWRRRIAADDIRRRTTVDIGSIAGCLAIG